MGTLPVSIKLEAASQQEFYQAVASSVTFRDVNKDAYTGYQRGNDTAEPVQDISNAFRHARPPYPQRAYCTDFSR